MATAVWHEMVRRRLLAGETIDGPTIRRDVGRRVGIYTFLKHLDEREGWVFQQTLNQGRHMPVTQYKLVGFRVVDAPACGPRVDLAHDQRPTEVIRRRLLAGEELENQAVADELGCTSSALTYVKHQLEDEDYEVVTRREQYRVFTKVKRKRRSRRKSA